MFNGSHNFSAAGITVPDYSAGDGELINADGYTKLYNFTTESYAPYEGYVKGKFASPTVPGAYANGYKVYSSVIASGNDRTIFVAGDKVVRTYQIQMPTGQFVFGYAVDASWAPPTKKPVTEPKNDFPPEANSPEPWYIHVYAGGPGLTDLGGSSTLFLSINDHGGASTHLTPWLYCPELWDGAIAAYFSSQDAGYSTLYRMVSNLKGAPAGKYKILIEIEDNENAGTPPHLPLVMYQVVNIEVTHDSGFAKTWGGPGNDSGYGIDVDFFGNIYVGGIFESGPEGVDFDPGVGEDIHVSNGLTDMFISKYDKEGNYSWTITMGGTGIDTVSDVCMDASFGRLYIVGAFSSTVDFNPKGTPDTRTSEGPYTDAYIASYDENGYLLWVQSWGSLTGIESAEAVDAKANNVKVCGFCPGGTDFDPGPGDHTIYGLGGFEAYISRFNWDGTWISSEMWGGPEDDAATAVSIYSSGYVVTGWFKGNADMDPSQNELFVQSKGFEDAFVLCYDTADTNVWGRFYGGTLSDAIWDIDNNGNEDFYFAGSFGSTVDFNVYGSNGVRTSNGSIDAFLLCTDNLGGFNWVNTWGGLDTDYATSLSYLVTGYVYTGGHYGDTVDFDPSGGMDSRTSNGYLDCFISKFTADGNYQWANTFGSNTETDFVQEVETLSDESVFATGSFNGTLDFSQWGAGGTNASNGLWDAYLVRFQADGSW